MERAWHISVESAACQVALDGTTDPRRQNLSDGSVGAVRTASSGALLRVRHAEESFPLPPGSSE